MKFRRSTMTSFLILVSLVLIFSSWNIPYAQIKLTDNLSLSGFLDISAETSIAEDEDTEINTSLINLSSIFILLTIKFQLV